MVLGLVLPGAQFLDRKNCAPNEADVNELDLGCQERGSLACRVRASLQLNNPYPSPKY